MNDHRAAGNKETGRSMVVTVLIVASALILNYGLSRAEEVTTGRTGHAHVAETPSVTATPSLTASATATPTASPTPMPRTVESIESPNAQMPVDGEWDQWPDIAGFVLDATTADTVAGAVPASSDLSTWVRTVWYFNSGGDAAQSWLYFAIEVTDDAVRTDSPDTEVWNDDSVELGLDPELDRYHPYPPVTDHQFTVTADNRVADWGTVVTDTILSATKITASGYRVEVGVPFSALGITSRPAPGTTIGFTLAVNDDDGNTGGHRESYLVWGGPNTNDFTLAHGQLRFVITFSTPTGTPTNTPTVTATTSITPSPTATPGRGGVSGLVWDDRDADGTRDGDEPPLAAAIVELYGGNCLSGGALASSVVTAGDGLYTFVDLVADDYCVRESNPPGFDESTYPDLIFGVPYWSVHVVPDKVTTNVDFGDRVSGPTPTRTPNSTITVTPPATPCPSCRVFLPFIGKG